MKRILRKRPTRAIPAAVDTPISAAKAPQAVEAPKSLDDVKSMQVVTVEDVVSVLIARLGVKPMVKQINREGNNHRDPTKLAIAEVKWSSADISKAQIRRAMHGVKETIPIQRKSIGVTTHVGQWEWCKNQPTQQPTTMTEAIAQQRKIRTGFRFALRRDPNFVTIYVSNQW